MARARPLASRLRAKLRNHHIAALDSTGHVAIGDIMNARADMEFHDANRPATRTFDVVVASEVIEHFRNPTTDFPKLMQFVGEDGVLVCGTTLRSARPLVQQRYAFYPDHTSLYTPRSLQLIARGIDAQVDFRPVQGAGNKRYVIFTRTAEKMERVIAHFGNHPFGPSEKTAG
ncbi:methyltransferase domain-containing protein [Nocardioides sp. Bht2]|uniref:methyltransferase domain-containing protein n=1 Tax=Nocardioides sp. Bht2 TaxID=3392297 RepID=UPI0039B54DA0